MKTNAYAKQAKTFTKALRAVRQDRDLSQTDVAEYMRALGFPWAQNTVHQVEVGARPIRLAEALALNDFLELRDYKAIGSADLAKILALASTVQKLAEALSTQVAEAISDLDGAINQATVEGEADGSES